MGVPQGTIMLVSLEGLWGGQKILFTHTYKLVTAVPDATTPRENMIYAASRLTNGGGDDIVTTYLSCLSSNYTCQFIRCQPIYPTRYAYYKEPVDEPGINSAANTGNVAGVVTLQTEFAGRNQISNKHIGPLAVDAYTAGLIENDTLDALNNLGLKLLDDVQASATTGVWEPCIYHRSSNLSTTLARHAVNPASRTMRRRTVGLGI